MTTAGFAYLLLVLVIVDTWGFLEAAVPSILAALAFDYFFVPPILGFTPNQIRGLEAKQRGTPYRSGPNWRQILPG
jgi:two-component system sensor histidine kinase KdpD